MLVSLPTVQWVIEAAKDSAHQHYYYLGYATPLRRNLCVWAVYKQSSAWVGTLCFPSIAVSGNELGLRGAASGQYIYIYIYTYDNAKTVYQEALNKSGYNYNLSYNEPRNEIQHSRKNRPRNILWYNPPFSKNVKTNVGKCFLPLIDQHFPNSHSLHKIFNRNTLKLSYSCMTNIKTIISNHNKAQINKSDPTNDSNCNCRNSSMCPMDGKCNDQNMIYQAEVTTTTSRETYIGLCDTTFKLRYRNHVCSFKNKRRVLYS